MFAWLSALYFRGKLAYARAFADTSPRAAASLVMAPILGLRRPEAPISAAHLAAMATMDVKSDDFVALLRRDAEVVRNQLAADAQVVLLSSIARDKYVATLLDVFGGAADVPVRVHWSRRHEPRRAAAARESRWDRARVRLARQRDPARSPCERGTRTP